MIEIDFSQVDNNFTHSSMEWPVPRLFVSSPGELKFKLAACSLIFRGIYPSGRQIMNELGRTGRTKGKCNLNGQESNWKSDIFIIFNIRPYYGYTPRVYRSGWDDVFDKIQFKYERGPKGTLVKAKAVKHENTDVR